MSEFFLEPRLFTALVQLRDTICTADPSDGALDIVYQLFQKSRREFCGFSFETLVEKLEELRVLGSEKKGLSFFSPSEIL